MPQPEWIFKSTKIDKAKSDPDNGVFIGYASKFNEVDFENDIMEKGCFKRTLQNKGAKRVMLWQHDPYTPVGSGYHKEDDVGLEIRTKINKETTMGRNAIELVKAEDIDGLSIGFTIVTADRTGNQRVMREVNLWETSIATFPCLDKARLSTIKSFFMGVDREEKNKFSGIQDAVRYFDEVLQQFDEKQIVCYKTDIENLVNKGTALLLKAGLVSDPFKNTLNKKTDDGLAKVIEELKSVNEHFRKVFSNAK